MARSVWKGPFVELSLLKKAEAAQDKGGRTPIKTWSRRSTILTRMSRYFVMVKISSAHLRLI